MSKAIIEVDHISKRYQLGTFGARSLRDESELLWRRAKRKWLGAAGTGQTNQRANPDFWALKDISFAIPPGQVVGVIGRNGAGKSTLLKILSRITEPTQGHITMRGKVASLLEVGTGFHPELSGRDNVYLNGAILGMKRAEITRKFDEIVDFADVHQFIDTPVKRYSSGMYVRLAFAVAAHLEPDILVIDEVLAVGDVEFQNKCLGKINDVACHQGRTVLFVSHNMSAIATLTSRCILLGHGSVIADGGTKEVLAKYMKSAAANRGIYLGEVSKETAHVRRFELKTSEADGVQANGRPMSLEVEVSTPEPLEYASLSLQAYNQFDQPVLHLWMYDSERRYCRQPGTFLLKCDVPNVRLNVGSYRWKISFGESKTGRHFETIDGVCAFEVTIPRPTIDYGWRPEVCSYLEDYSWTVESAEGQASPRPVLTTR